MESIQDQAIVDQMEFDRISALPDPLAHHILSFLPTKDAARTSVLSKRWDMLCLTSPILIFDEKYFYRRDEGAITCRSRFLGHMQTSLAKRNDDLKQVTKLQVSSYLPGNDELNCFVDRLLALAIQGKVRELDLSIKNFMPVEESFHQQHYVLSEIILSSGSCLVSLLFEDCQIRKSNVVNLPSLKNLTVTYVDITDEMLSEMVVRSRLLETLKLEYCKRLKSFKIINPSLKCMIVSRCNGLNAFELDAPSLDSFTFDGFCPRYNTGIYDHHRTCSEISEFKTSTANSLCLLKTLVLFYVKMKDETFTHLFSCIPNIETLSLTYSIFEKVPSILVEKLKHLEIIECHFDEPVEINAPNLESLLHKSYNGPKNCKLKHSGSKGFNTLKTLSLYGYSGLTDQSLKDLLSSCPILENLTLKSCPSLKHIHITSSTLKTLVVDRCSRLEDGSEVDIPKLEYFKYVGPLIEFNHMATSSELKAEVDLRSSSRVRTEDNLNPIKLKNLLRSFGEAKVLKLATNEYDIIIVKEICPFQPVYFPRQLTVVANSRISMSYIDLLLGILHISLFQEALLIFLGEGSIDLKFQVVSGAEERELLSSEWVNHNCLKDHLSEVSLENFGGNSKEMELIEFLLGTATALKSMRITFTEESSNWAIDDRANIITKIMNYPKAGSPFVEVEFK